MQQFLKATARLAWAKIIPSELLEQNFVAVHDTEAASHARFGRVSPSSAC
jgi:hypothetical protein